MLQNGQRLSNNLDMIQIQKNTHKQWQKKKKKVINSG